jgi:hypothetical protein
MATRCARVVTGRPFLQELDAKWAARVARWTDFVNVLQTAIETVSWIDFGQLTFAGKIGAVEETAAWLAVEAAPRELVSYRLMGSGPPWYFLHLSCHFQFHPL